MLKFGIVGVAFVASVSSGLAADLPIVTKAPPLVWSWTGFYGGVHAGGGFFADDPSATARFQRFTGGGNTPHPLQTGVLGDSERSFGLGGVQFGYNYQMNQWLIGVETDFSGVSLRRELVSPLLAEGPATFQSRGTEQLRWLGTVRARAGFVQGPWLLYVTGGFAYGQTEGDFSGVVTGPGPVGTFTVLQNTTTTKTGWTAGGGIEYAVTPKFRIKTEYQYVSLDGQTNGISPTTIVFNAGQRAIVSTTSQNPDRFHTLRIGVNYGL
jgi:outer membrane immunogenic protein